MSTLNPNASEKRTGFFGLAFILTLLFGGNILAQTYTFTPCGATGRYGPTQTQANSTYSSTILNGQVTVTSGIQYWLVPATGLYRVECYGAKGGNSSSPLGGSGTKMQGDFSLTIGQTLKILVGQTGVNGIQGGGGGGSFVVDNNNTPLIVAGGGGGGAYLAQYSYSASNSGGSTGTSGMSGVVGNASLTAGLGGSSGGGGSVSTTYTSAQGSGGGGFSNNGVDGNPATGGLSFANGGAGGVSAGSPGNYPGDGGFGGGGGADWSNNTGAGGGGGYSGGGGGVAYGCGGGGGSYNAGASQTNTAAYNAGNGYVVFTKISGVNITQTSSVTCYGQANAVLTASAFGGVAPYTYSWSSGGVTSATITGLGAGTYTCVATDSSSPAVVYTNTFVVTQPASLSASISQTNVTCFGGANGKLKATPSGGTSPYTYTWSPGAITTSLASNLTAGVYTLTIKDANNCVSNYTANIVQPSAFTIFAFASSPTVCSGGSSALAAAGTGGTPAYTYTWSGGVSNGVAFTQTATATYTVNGTDANGCTSSTTASILVNPSPTLSVVGSGTVCSGNSVTLTASGASSYTWNGAVTSSSLIVNMTTSVTTAASFTVAGSNSNGCQGMAIATVTVIGNPTISVTSSTPSVCQGNPVTLTASGAISYTWSNGVTNATSFTPSSTSSYTVTGSGACATGSAMVSVTVNPIPTISINASSTLVCAGSTVILSGSGGVSYSWSNGVINNSPFTPTSTLTYFTTGTDANGCQATASKIVSVNPVPNVTANASSTFICSGNSLTLFGSGANTYTWSGGVSDNVAFSPTISASYTVTGTDGNGCQNTAVKTISVGNIPLVTANTTTNSVCLGGSTALFGGGATSYTWSGGVSNNVSFSPTITATYTVSGSNACGTTTNTIVITVNPLPTITANTTQSVICAGYTTSLFGGGGQTYTWTGGVSNNVSFTPGTTTSYTVTGRDANGCQNTAVKTITVNSLPVVTASVSNAAVCAGSSVTLNGGGANIYTWNPSVTNGLAFVPSATTSYSVTGTNTLTGCTSTNIAVVTVTVNPLPSVSVNSTGSVICIGSSVTLSGTNANTYAWTNGVTNGVPFSPSVTTTYSVTGTNTLTGCINTATTSVTVNSLPIVSIGVSGTSLCAGGTATLNGAGANTYTWSGGVQNGVPFSPTATANYSLVGTNTLTGCTSTNMTVATVTVYPIPTVAINASTTHICKGDPVSLTASGADTYVWTGGVTNAVSFTLAANSSFSVTGTNTLTGCSSTNLAVQNITVFSLPFIQANTSNPLEICVGETAHLTASGAISYTWAPSGNTGSVIAISPSVTSIYTVTGVDANGCKNEAILVQNVGDCTGIENSVKNKIALLIFPNPFNDKLTVETTGSSELFIFDLKGVLVLKTKLDGGKNEINTSELKAGIYLIQARNGESVWRGRFVRVE